MKNLFKSKIRWQHRSNEPTPVGQPQAQGQQQPPPTPSPASSPSGTGAPSALSCSTGSASPNSAAATPAGAAAAGAGGGADYISSEEEFQIQLAMALSASNSDCVGDLDGDQIMKAKLMSLDRFAAHRDEGLTAESLSRRYWDYNFLDYHEKVIDGFYDIFGSSIESSKQGRMPSLADLQTGIGDLGFEVIVINRAIDSTLQEMEQVAQCILLDFPVANVAVLVQRIAELVTDNMGGPVKDANDMLTRWLEKSTELRSSLQTSLLPIGCIKIGLSRHRALLFKILADRVGIPCKLVKGSNYTGGGDDDAINIIKMDNEREFLVDLMAAPGTLIPADILSWKGNSLNSNRKLGLSTAGSSSTCDSNLDPSALPLEPKGGQLPAFGIGALISDSQSGYETAAATVSSQTSSGGTSSVPAGSVFDSSWALVSHEQSDEPSTSAGTSSQQKVVLRGGEHPRNINRLPDLQENPESRNLFADLNPFGGVESKKTSVPFKGTDNRNNELQRRRENVVPNAVRPQQRLVMKNWSPYNDVSNNKQYNYVEDSFARRNVGDNVASSSQVPRPAARNTNLNVGLRNDRSYAAPPHNYDSIMAGTSAMKITSTGETGKVPERVLRGDLDKGPTNSRLEDQHCLVQPPQERHLWGNPAEGRVPMNRVQNQAKQHMENLDVKQDHKKLFPDPKKSPLDRFMDTSMSSRNMDVRSHRLDTMFDDVSECEIPWDDLVIGERIGLGSYGEVYRADWNGTEVAVKKFLDQDFYGDALDEFRSEVRIMRRLRHPNIVLFMGAVTRPPNLSILSEYLPRGSLYKILHRPNCQIDEKRRIKMALDVAKGMNCLHTSVPTIVHRDLKSPNLLVDNNWNVKVCDFGLSRLKHSTFLSSKSTAGTPEWMAPEVLRNEQSNEKCDVYSFGVILWELATLRMPWGGMNPMQVVGAVGFQDRRLDIPKEVDPLVARIIFECWQKDPNLRPSFAQLTSALKTVQRLVTPSHQETQSSPVPQEISVKSTP
ncbi:serine/threonine-protein kinase EDR1-like [Phragmites australis]|uniref:serine/threonine-protein kinase EDR1-like n=1 Tax=Phragmites australis TaxID=29695 RepID=UPI002D7656E3|nr:serine/threonine-protein kinase EDR1-like [Phragmites australis]